MTKDFNAAVRVSASRLRHGTWSQEANKTLGCGDIAASYSGDLIAMQAKVRKPYVLEGKLCVTVATGSYPQEYVEAYQLIELASFDGTPTTYRDRVSLNDGDTARNDPNGFYHGMTVTHGGNQFVLCGPPLLITASEEPELKQGELF